MTYEERKELMINVAPNNSIPPTLTVRVELLPTSKLRRVPRR